MWRVCSASVGLVPRAVTPTAHLGPGSQWRRSEPQSDGGRAACAMAPAAGLSPVLDSTAPATLPQHRHTSPPLENVIHSRKTLSSLRAPPDSRGESVCVCVGSDYFTNIPSENETWKQSNI